MRVRRVFGAACLAAGLAAAASAQVATKKFDWHPENGAQDIDVHMLHQGFLRGMRSQGGELRSGITIEAAARIDGRWEIRLADGETLRAGA